MQLEKITLKLRRRTPWEALDLGHALLRSGAGPAYRAWLGSFGVASVIIFALFWQTPWLNVLLLWWIKPLCDRAILFSLSRSLFGTQLSWREQWRAWPALLRSPGILSGLTLRRLSMARSFLMPVWQLEEQHGTAARQRMRVLARRSRGAASWLTFVCANLSNILSIAFPMLVLVLLPVGSMEDFDWRIFSGQRESTFWAALLLYASWVLAEGLIEPLYVASGFALYLNRRSELEGWDIDVGFRQMNARHLATPALASLAALCLCAALWMQPGKAMAEATSPSPEKQTITEILRDPVFGHEVHDTEWRPKQRKQEEEKEAPDAAWLAMLSKIFEAIASASRVLVWIVAAMAVAALLYVLIRYRDRWLPAGRSRAVPPEFLFGLDVRPESLPSDIPGAVRTAIAAGRIEEALSLLYRATLVVLIHRLHVEFRAGDTEGDCLRRVNKRLEAPSLEHFEQLLNCWRAAAYAHQLPSASTCTALCEDWERHFGARRPA